MVTTDTAPETTTPTAPAATPGEDRAAREAKKRMQGADFQQMFSQNPLGAFFMLILALSGDFDENSMMGGALSSLLGQTFGIDNPGGLIQGLSPPPHIGHIDVGERQLAVNTNLGNAAEAAGISCDLAAGIWGIETSFGTHCTLVSGSGCAGDFQFCKGTFDSMMKKHGAEIAALAGDQISPDVRNALRAGNWKMETQWGSDLRFHPAVATYAAAFYMREVADGLGVDPKDPKNFGAIYAGYNVGPGNADKLLDLQRAGIQTAAAGPLGSAASWNPAFYKGGASASEALARYQDHVMTRVADYHQNFDTAAPVATADAGRTTSYAKGGDEPVLKTAFDAQAAGAPQIETAEAQPAPPPPKIDNTAAPGGAA